MIEKAQNAWIQIRCEQKSFKRAQVLKNLVVILKLNQKRQMLESKTVKRYLNFLIWPGDICNNICNVFHGPVVTYSDESLLISNLLKWYYDEIRIFSIEAILKHKQGVCMRRKMPFIFFQISLFVPEIFSF